jgi:hypothetical protein
MIIYYCFQIKILGIIVGAENETEKTEILSPK